MFSEQTKKSAEIDGITTGWLGIHIAANIRVIVGIVLSDDLDYDAHADSKGVPTAEHVTDNLFDARPRHELTSELVGANAGLLILGGIGRDGDDGLDEVASSGLRGPAMLRSEEGEERGNDILGIEPLRRGERDELVENREQKTEEEGKEGREKYLDNALTILGPLETDDLEQEIHNHGAIDMT